MEYSVFSISCMTNSFQVAYDYLLDFILVFFFFFLFFQISTFDMSLLSLDVDILEFR